uniref:Uncharacterized protein n=1 Tax=Rhizophora mucronata TaxID=61149 RepID=A0A2P2Q4F7_RHIMU
MSFVQLRINDCPWCKMCDVNFLSWYIMNFSCKAKTSSNNCGFV